MSSHRLKLIFRTKKKMQKILCQVAYYHSYHCSHAATVASNGKSSQKEAKAIAEIFRIAPYMVAWFCSRNKEITASPFLLLLGFCE
jgi:hypothetical protein